jgi:alkylation response protein AidB-like acyl-CoA dehydrogenase
VLRLPDALESFRLSLRQRAEARIGPLVAGIDERGTFSAELWSELRDAGIFGLPFAEELGGQGGSFLAFAVATEELARVGAIAGLYPGTTVQVAGTVLALGTAEQRARWLPPLIAGEAPAAWAFTEPQTGSDPKQIETTAVRRPSGDWVLSGQKLFISYARQAMVALVFARVEQGLATFLVPTDTTGYRPGTPFRLLGFGGGEAAPLFLDDVVLPADALLGEAGRGFEAMLAGEAEGKVRASAINVGIAQRAVEEAGRYALQRQHRGEAIADKFPTIRALLGEMDAEVQAGRVLVRSVAQLIDDGAPDIARATAAARIVTGRAAREVTSNALQICGAYGWTTELVVERLYREAKFFEVTQGVTEIQKTIVARAVLDELRRNA